MKEKRIKILEKKMTLVIILFIISLCMAGDFDDGIAIQVIGWIGLLILTPIHVKLNLEYEAIEERSL